MVGVFLISSNAQAAVKSKVKAPLIIKVPFTVQAPLANWSDSRQQDGCEEAVSLMAMAWVKGEGLKAKDIISKAEFEKRIITLSDFEKKNYGEYRDVNVKDIITWIFKGYFKYEKVSLKKVSTSGDILNELEKGRIVLLPMNGQKLKNPNFKSPGPLTHMILIKGFDYRTKEFITNDPGTRRGENYRYSEKVILGAIRVYSTGYHEKLKTTDKSMIIVEK